MEQTNTLSTGLPLLYEAWLGEWLDGPVPTESNATCSNCAMVPPADGLILAPNNYFNPKVKCCTYIPALPNFLVGGILADERPDMARGKESTLARLQHAKMANPLWLEKSSLYSYKYEARRDFFGRLDEMVCPHYIDEQGGLCGIWLHRNGTCTTWFCKHTRGDVGYRFWTALRDLLIAIENDLAQWCALELDISPEAVKNLGHLNTREKTIHLLEVEQSQPNLPANTHKKIWGTWHGRENEYYVACASLVKALNWPQVLAVCGPQVNALARLVQQAYAQHQSDAVPERLRPGNFKVVSMQAEYSIVESYLGSDTLKIPRRVLDLLPRFDGRPTPEVITEIALVTGLKVNPSLISKLADFKILVPAED